jgi:4-hydroxy-tetrahydrodipicolinate reductase
MKIALLGYGKMGRAIEDALIERTANCSVNHEVVFRGNKSNSSLLTPQQISQSDVAIEFSSPQSAVDNIMMCFAANVPVVVGTTGWLEQWDSVSDYCLKNGQAMFFAPNFSIGVNILFEINKKLAQLISPHKMYDVKMEEIHHTQKLDAPSGTAIKLAEEIIESSAQKTSWVNQPSALAHELSIVSKRETDVPGTHKVTYTSKLDSLEIKHTAHSRKGFAQGAVLAAEWLLGKSGVFSMDDLLGV